MKQKKLRSAQASVFWALICCAVLAHSSLSQKKNVDGLDRSFEVKLNKNTYFRFEPVFAHFKANLPGGEKPMFLRETSIKVSLLGQTKDFGVLSQTEAPQLLPKIESPNLDMPGNEIRSVTYETDESIERIGEFFQSSGVYQIQFFLHRPTEVLASNVIEITVQEPSEGIDKQAFDILKKYEDPISFNWIWKEKNGLPALESFVANYGQSVYGELAIRYLANVYKAKDELDKAQTEFEKIRLSKNKSISNDAKMALVEIDQRRINLAKSNHLD